MSYNKSFYKDLANNSTLSAKMIVPLVYKKIKPRSVLDIGCGAGGWLKVWQDMGDVSIKGVDGNWIDETQLIIGKDNFIRHNLDTKLELNNKFDLVTTLEVAEHIYPTNAEIFVDNLVRHGDVILFSAAIPGQGGTNHFNEQWPTYWVEIFEKKGYELLDPFRHLIWNNSAVRTHYKQNILLFVKNDCIEGNNFFEVEQSLAKRSLVSVVHPHQFRQITDPAYISLKQETKRFLSTLKRFILKKLKI